MLAAQLSIAGHSSTDRMPRSSSLMKHECAAASDTSKWRSTSLLIMRRLWAAAAVELRFSCLEHAPTKFSRKQFVEAELSLSLVKTPRPGTISQGEAFFS